jgi:hypothetical protein
MDLLSSVHRFGILMGRAPTVNRGRYGRRAMAKLAAVLVVLASFLLVAPVIESGTQTAVKVFHAIGNADGGDGGGW